MKILVIGRNGQLATELMRWRWPDSVQCVAAGRPDLDATDAASVAACLAAHAPDLLVNAAAWTQVDLAETERDGAFALNATAPRILARAAAARGLALIHVSTDYVFDGRSGHPLREDDPVSPLGVYGASKLAGEDAVRAETARHVILRTSGLFAAHGRNFVRTMLRLGKEKRAVSVIDDQWTCPTPAADLARVIASIAAVQGPYGTYHYCGEGAVTWHDFAREIFARAGLHPELRRASAVEFAAPARRPARSVLDAGKIWRDYRIAQRPWREGLDAVLKELAA
ncbi:MAG TPA: dTDP-4-dehydrorhamnose reductase [Rhizomicrobium sp.]|nr:dTDP-4-dehydrorhamnose reductase [Rhizomicrobium sp.]